MNNKGLKILVSILSVVFVACIVVTVSFKDNMDFNKAKGKGTVEAYESFVRNHPNSEFCSPAKKSLDSLYYYETIRKGTIKEYVDFLENHSNSEYVNDIKRLVDVWDDSVFDVLSQKYDNTKACFYLQYLPQGKHAIEVEKMRLAYEEDDIYQTALAFSTVENLQKYIDRYPQGKHAKEIRTKLTMAQEEVAYSMAKNQATAESYRDYLSTYPNGKHRAEIRGKLDDLEAYDRYKNNSLSNGSQPYASYYGYNRSCDYYGCSKISVKAPYLSDVVVIIKRNNSDGSVVRHGYIKSGCTMSFEIPDGWYQTFFYYGKGWYPNKRMSGGVRGGFLEDEIFSKDNPQYLSNQVLTYELILQRNGNFSTKPSSESEVF